MVITSGTLSPIEMYPKILGFTPCAVHSFAMSFSRNVICPLVVTRGADQVSTNPSPNPSPNSNPHPARSALTPAPTLTPNPNPSPTPNQAALSSKFDLRSEPATIRNYGKLLVDMAAVVPDGMVAFFTSYSYMQQIVREWDAMGVLKQALHLRSL